MADWARKSKTESDDTVGLSAARGDDTSVHKRPLTEGTIGVVSLVSLALAAILALVLAFSLLFGGRATGAAHD